jgi:ABC-type transporter lipoprotein component MlaA
MHTNNMNVLQALTTASYYCYDDDAFVVLPARGPMAMRETTEALLSIAEREQYNVYMLC